MQTKLEWRSETLSDFNDGKSGVMIERMKVIGGWIVSFAAVNNKGGVSLSTQFVKDQDHQWVIVKPKPDEVKEKAAIAKDFEAPKS